MLQCLSGSNGLRDGQRDLQQNSWRGLGHGQRLRASEGWSDSHDLGKFLLIPFHSIFPTLYYTWELDVVLRGGTLFGSSLFPLPQ